MMFAYCQNTHWGTKILIWVPNIGQNELGLPIRARFRGGLGTRIRAYCQNINLGTKTPFRAPKPPQNGLGLLIRACFVGFRVREYLFLLKYEYQCVYQSTCLDSPTPPKTSSDCQSEIVLVGFGYQNQCLLSEYQFGRQNTCLGIQRPPKQAWIANPISLWGLLGTRILAYC